MADRDHPFGHTWDLMVLGVHLSSETVARATSIVVRSMVVDM